MDYEIPWIANIKNTASNLGLNIVLHTKDKDLVLTQYRFLAYIAICRHKWLKGGKAFAKGQSLNEKIVSIINFQNSFLELKEIECFLFTSCRGCMPNKHFHKRVLKSVLELVDKKEIISFVYKSTVFYGLKKWFKFDRRKKEYSPILKFLQYDDSFENL